MAYSRCRCRALGFQVDLLSAAVARETGGFGPEFDHLTLLVHLEQDWLADVGFGESFRQPLRVASRARPSNRVVAAIAWSVKVSSGSIRSGTTPGSLPTVFTCSHMHCVTLPPCATITKPHQHHILLNNGSVPWQRLPTGLP
jgi:N-acetyltransferase